jgi:hypothetical protein
MNLNRIASRTKYIGGEWRVLLTPVEIVFLIESHLVKGYNENVDYLKGMIARGESGLHNFYFQRPLGTMKELLGNKMVRHAKITD